MGPTIGYVVFNFPKLSETFIVEELLALDARGVRPFVYAREPLAETTTNRRADPLISRTTWLSPTSRWAQLAAAAWVAIRHPLRLARCCRVAIGSKSRWTLVNLRYSLVLARRAKTDGVRYLHAHFAGDAAELAYFAAEILGIPFGVTIHAVDIYLGRFLCEKLRAASLLVTVCDYNVGQLVERCPDRLPSDYLVKFAGIDASQFELSSPRPPRPGRRILAIGRLTVKKGFDVLIRAVHELVEQGRDIECVIIGEGRDAPELLAVAVELGVQNNVTFVGSATPEEIKRQLETADVLAAPCTLAPWGDRDSMPVVLKEALAMELPVVSTNDFGIPEIVTDDVGVLVPRDDVAALAAALDRVLSLTPEQRAAMGRAGRALVRARFHEPELVEPLAKAFDKVSGTSSGA